MTKIFKICLGPPWHTKLSHRPPSISKISILNLTLRLEQQNQNFKKGFITVHVPFCRATSSWSGGSSGSHGVHHFLSAPGTPLLPRNQKSWTSRLYWEARWSGFSMTSSRSRHLLPKTCSQICFWFRLTHSHVGTEKHTQRTLFQSRWPQPKRSLNSGLGL